MHIDTEHLVWHWIRRVVVVCVSGFLVAVQVAGKGIVSSAAESN